MEHLALCIKKDQNAMYRHDIWISYDRPMTVTVAAAGTSHLWCAVSSRGAELQWSSMRCGNPWKADGNPGDLEKKR